MILTDQRFDAIISSRVFVQKVVQVRAVPFHLHDLDRDTSEHGVLSEAIARMPLTPTLAFGIAAKTCSFCQVQVEGDSAPACPPCTPLNRIRATEPRASS